MADNLEDRLSIAVKCNHKKNDDFHFHHYVDSKIDVKAYLCSDCSPNYTRILNGYRKKEAETDDGFDERNGCFRMPDGG